MQPTHVSKVLTATLAPSTRGDLAITRTPLAEHLTAGFKTMSNPELIRMRYESVRLCGDLQARKSPRWLTLAGPSGTGKTLLAKAINRYVLQKGRYFRMNAPGGVVVQAHDTFFAKWGNVIEEMRKGDFSTVHMLCEKKENRSGALVPAIWFAVIDDIGQVEDSIKSYILGALGRIADARMGAWTVWTCNLGMEQIAQRLDQRIASRMIRDGNVVAENHARDFNLR